MLWALLSGSTIALLIAIVVGWSWNSIQADAVPLEKGEMETLAETEGSLASREEAEEIQKEFEELSEYGDISEEKLAAIVEQARREGRLADKNFESTVDRGVPIPDEDFDSWLMIGSDEAGGLADVIIYIVEPKNGGIPAIVSLPRDLWIESPCTKAYARINVNLHGCGDDVGGPVLVALAVQQFTGIPVDHFVLLDFDGFVDVVDAVGGVQLCFDEPTRDRKSHLAPTSVGCTIANGQTALAWVRSRHTQVLRDGSWGSVGADDFSRQNHQREVLWALADKISDLESLTSLITLVSSLSSAIRIDETWTFSDAASDMWNHRNLSEDSVEKIVLEVENYRTETGAAVLIPTRSFTELLAEVYP